MSRQSELAGLLVIGIATLSALPAALADGPPPRYVVTTFGTLMDGGTTAYALNDLGQTTGESGQGTITVGTHAFLGQPDGTLENIETVPGYDISEGQVINNAGQIAGTLTYFPAQSGLSSLFYYTPTGGMVDIGTLGGTNGIVADINEAGDVVGWWDDAGGEAHAFMYAPDTGLVDLGMLGDYESRARDMNESRQVVGYSWTLDFDRHAFLWENGAMQDLGTLGGDHSEAYYISNAGVVVGQSTDAAGVSRAFRYTAAGGMEALPAPTGATSAAATWVGDSGAVVGWWSEAGGDKHCFLYTDSTGAVDFGDSVGTTGWAGPVKTNQAAQTIIMTLDDQTYETFGNVYDPASGMYRLADLLAVPSDLSISEVFDINESGQIVAMAQVLTPQFDQYAVLLSPITPGDLDADGDVDLTDLASLLSKYGVGGAIYADGDIDGDEDVDLADLAYLLGVYGQ